MELAVLLLDEFCGARLYTGPMYEPPIRTPDPTQRTHQPDEPLAGS